MSQRREHKKRKQVQQIIKLLNGKVIQFNLLKIWELN